MTEKRGSGSSIEQLRQRNRELSVLNAIAEGLNREVDLARALNTALVQVIQLIDLQTGWVWLLDEGSGQSYLAAYRNLPPGLVDNPDLMEGDCYCLETYRRGDLGGAANINVVTCSRLAMLVDGADGLRYHASIPLYAPAAKRVGVLNVASPNWRQLSEDDLRILYTVGDMLSIAIERARLFERSVELGTVEERNRLAREIHDTLAQGLAAISLQLETAEVHLEDVTGLESASQAVHKALTLTQDSLEEARRSVLDLPRLLSGRADLERGPGSDDRRDVPWRRDHDQIGNRRCGPSPTPSHRGRAVQDGPGSPGQRRQPLRSR